MIHQIKTNSQIRDTLLCQSRAKLKVVKWCQKRWNWPILMYIYHKQCEIIQKIQWKGSNSQLQCFYNGRSLTDRSSLLKMKKTRETKTWITQNFELVWPIQGRTMWKSTSRGFQKCGSFRDFEVLNHSYRLSKSGQIQKKKIGFTKNELCHNNEFGMLIRNKCVPNRSGYTLIPCQRPKLIIVAVLIFFHNAS